MVGYPNPSHFDNPDKDCEWHTAFYYLAEHIRYLSDGAVNHKMLYSLVGTDGRYVNHDNPLVRKRTAGALSRLIHTKRYVNDLRKRYMQNNAAFSCAAGELVDCLSCNGRCSIDELPDYLENACWHDVRRGLANERAEWRGALDLFRIDQEMNALFEGIDAHGAPSEVSETILAAILHVIAFGSLDSSFARSLVDRRPTGMLDDGQGCPADETDACLIKFRDVDRSAVMGAWIIPSGRLFSIGRYTDCDVVEANPSLSRMHCCIYRKAGVWNFEDLGSRNGSRVTRGNAQVVFDSFQDGSRVPFKLQHGDTIVLAGNSFYWFGAVAHDSPYAITMF